ncbi:MAG: hypothetical protein OSB09_00930 [Planctomycetota bacterium]|nr:hypothetical protein [Planctomycetota bacterium]
MVKPERNLERGMALLMVILVLSALAAIGTPFVISMKLQERGAARAIAQQHAQLAAQSARGHALSRLFDTHHSRERDRWRPGVEAPDLVDGLDELKVDFPGVITTVPVVGTPPEDFQIRGNSQVILDARVTDEQGKININSAMPNLMGNLLAGSHLSEAISYETDLGELPLDDTSSFPADDDPETIDGVVVILNPIFFTVEAISYTGKTETALTGIFRGQYLSGTWEHQKGWPVFDLRGLKVFLHRLANLSDGEIATFRTPIGIRQIADWSVVPYFLKTLAVVGLNFKNMAEWGLTTEMLVRAGIDPSLLQGDTEQVDEAEYRKARKMFLDNNIPKDVVDLVESIRGKAAVIEAAEVVAGFGLTKARGNAFKGVYLTFIAPELKKIKKRGKSYFPSAILAYQEIFDLPGMETFSAFEFEQIRDLITTTSTQPRAWSQEQMVEGEITDSALLGVPQMRLPRYDFFNPGTVVRIRSIDDPSKVEYGLAAGAFPTPRGGFRGLGAGSIFQGGVILKEPLKYQWGEREAMVSAALRHPVNINTAPRRVLEAVLTGLSTDRFEARFNGVTVEEARGLTDLLMEAMPISGFAALREVVEAAQMSGVLDGGDSEAILINALNPNQPRLSISTTGFCYATSEIYTVESTGVARSPVGTPQATVRLREVIEVAPPDPLSLRLETQEDWSSIFLTRNSSGGMFSRFNTTFVPGRASNLVISGPIPLNRRKFTGPSLDEGTLRGATISYDRDSGNYGFGSVGLLDVEHFSETIEGYELEDGSWKRSILLQQETEPTRGRGRRGAAPDPQVLDQNSTEDALSTIPAMIDFWYRPRWGSRSGNRIIFDTVGPTLDRYRDRVRLFFSGDTQELVLQVFDETGSAVAWDTNVLPAAEVRHSVTTINFADDTWYHISAGWRSTRPGDLVLMIDRRPVGRQSWLSRLNGALSFSGNRVSIVDGDMATRFPPMGTLLVGSEAIDYSGREGAAFIVRSPGLNGSPPIGRGVRGTVRSSHAAGTPVRLLGYSLPIANSDPRRGLADSSSDIIIGPGGASLEIEITPTMRVAAFNTGTGAVELTPATFSRASTQIPFSAGSPVTSTLELEPFAATSSSLLVQTNGSHPLELGFPPRGYLHIQQWTQQGIERAQLVASEFAKYSSITPGPIPGLYRFTAMGRALLNSTATQGVITATSTTTLQVRGVSIESNATDLNLSYAPSGVIQIDYMPGSQSLGLLQDAEWIRYTQIAEGKFFICDPDQVEAFRGFTGDQYINTSDPFRRNRPLWDMNGIVRHAAGQEITQVVRAVGASAGFGDEVILGDGYGDPTTRLREETPLRVRKVRETDSGTYVSFYWPPEGIYRPGQDPRIRRFPSGGLPSSSNGEIRFGSSMISGDGIDAPGTLDEVRFSRLDSSDVDTYAFPAASNGGFRTMPIQASPGLPSGVRTEVLRSGYTEQDSEQPGGVLDKIHLLARSKLTASAVTPPEGATDFTAGSVRSFSVGDPRGFGLGKREGLFQVDDEVMHYTFDPGSVEASVVIQLEQDLPRDPYLDEDALGEGEVVPYDPNRDLRVEVVNIVRVNNTANLPPNGGFLEMISGPTNEVLYYQQASNGVLRNVLRGQLGSSVGGYVYQWSYTDAAGAVQVVTNTHQLRLIPSRTIDVMTRGMLTTERASNELGHEPLVPLPSIPVARLAGQVAESGLTLEVMGLPGNEGENRQLLGFPSGEGYLLVDDGIVSTPDEIIAHTGAQGGSFGLFRDDRTGKGIFRGRFGTDFKVHAAGTPVIELLARHHDRYQPLVESKDLQYLERAWTMPGTMWDRISWAVEQSRNRSTAGTVRILARFDGIPGWDSTPTNAPGGLYLFDDPDDANRLGRFGDAIEIRIHYRHRKGAFGLTRQSGIWNDEWKHLPILKSVAIEHRKEWRILHHEEYPY